MKKITIAQIIGLISAVLIIVGAFLTWGETFGFSVTGFDVDGKITLGIGVLSIIFLLIKKIPIWLVSILGAIIVIIGVSDLSSMSGINSELGFDVQENPFADLAKVTIGIGLYMTLLGGIGLIISPIIESLKK